MKISYAVAPFVLQFTLSTLANGLGQRQSDKQMFYGFDDIEATAELNWIPCFDTFTCTKLDVPLDYADEATGTTHVSFIKSSGDSTSTNSTTQDILFNPGGPGVSGVGWLLGVAGLLRSLIGTEYNFVSFDPRGVNNSGPDLSCFPSGEKWTNQLVRDLALPLNANDTRSYGEKYAKAAAFGDLCNKAYSAPNDTAKYANTVATATDMLHYTELLAQSNGQDPKKSQLWYYGASYGSILGTTFAALFPDRVGRVVVDGILDGEDYYEGKWLANIQDADKAWEYFFQTCYEAGEGGKCAFWAESPSAIQNRLQAIFDDISLNPIPVSIEVPDIITVSDLKSILIGVTANPLSPLSGFSVFANMLVDLEQRNGTSLAMFSGFGYRPIDIDPIEPRIFIMCTDANHRNDLSTYGKWVEYADKFVDQSRYLGEAWAGAGPVFCHNFHITAPESQIFHGIPSANQTSNPLLVISNAIDPGSPLQAAEKVTKRFGGAGLLVQDAVGHTSTSSPTACMYEYLRSYFKDASLPPAGTRCKAETVPF